jgi:hypothetical protein
LESHFLPQQLQLHPHYWNFFSFKWNSSCRIFVESFLSEVSLMVLLLLVSSELPITLDLCHQWREQIQASCE